MSVILVETYINGKLAKLAMFKRGQTTAFILLAIVIVLIVVSQIVIQEEPERAEGFEETAQGVQNFVQGCLVQVTDEALITVAHQGGLLFSTLAPTIDYGGKKVPVMSCHNPYRRPSRWHPWTPFGTLRQAQDSAQDVTGCPLKRAS